MKKHTALLTFAALVAAVSAFAQSQQVWQIDPNHSSATFASLHNNISIVRGEFGKVGGTVEYDGKDITKAKINATIDATTVNSRVEARDKHLKSADFLDVANHPTITFVSTSITPDGKGKYKMAGNLTIRGVTKPVTFELDPPRGPIKMANGATRIGAAARARINRLDWGVAFQEVMPTGGFNVASDLDIALDTELLIPPPPKPAAPQTR